MPSFVIHLAVADMYLKRHPEESSSEFYQGVIAPDLLKKPQRQDTSFKKRILHIAEIGRNIIPFRQPVRA